MDDVVKLLTTDRVARWELWAANVSWQAAADLNAFLGLPEPGRSPWHRAWHDAIKRFLDESKRLMESLVTAIRGWGLTATQAANSMRNFATASGISVGISVDAGPGMTIDELLGEIDDVLAAQPLPSKNQSDG